jgi:thiamine pyrophosphate-dependent acetolactate synthase large subunit-like protein
MTGLIGFSSGYHAMMNCDTLLMLGTDFPYRQFYPAQAKIAQVDLHAENIGRRCHVDQGVVGDVRLTAAALQGLLKPKTASAYRPGRCALPGRAQGAG